MCWPFADVWLEDPPAEKKEEKKKEYIMVPYGAQIYPPQPTPASNGDHIYTYKPAAPERAPAQPEYQYLGYYYGQQLQYQAPASAQYTYVPPQYQPQAQPVYYAQAPQQAQHHTWYGNTKAEIDAQNIQIAANTGTTQPTQLVPHDSDAAKQYWVRELDGDYTLRRCAEIMDELQPGYWNYSSSGYPYFIRTPK
ncbi:MAG: hypothetical protein M1827_000416 [Pycnora praestabilis]|nr:MAG: hypothetical protein M1827_000416 [Pycnora praestabilis]